VFSTRRKIKEKYGDNEKFSDKRNKLDVEKGDIPAMMIAAFVTLVIPVILILCVIFAIVWLIFLR
jgi:hypothetical protein